MRHSAKLSALVVIVACYSAMSNASAQGLFDIFGDHGGHHHHDAAGHRVDDAGHHIDNHGNHTGSWGVYDGDHSNEPHYYNSRPAYSVTPRTTYYAPSITPNALPQPVQPIFNSGEPIEIKYPGASGAVNYQLNDYKYSMGGGQSQLIQSDRAWVIAFDRGGNFGMAKYSLSPGTYHFTVTEKGWELLKQRPPQPQLAGAPAPPAPAPAATAPATPIPAVSITPASASNAIPAAN